MAEEKTQRLIRLWKSNLGLRSLIQKWHRLIIWKVRAQEEGLFPRWWYYLKVLYKLWVTTFHFSWTKNLKNYLLYLMIGPTRGSILSEMLHLPQFCLFQASPHDSMEHACPVHTETCSFQMPSHHFNTIRWHIPLLECEWGHTHQGILKLKCRPIRAPGGGAGRTWK